METRINDGMTDDKLDQLISFSVGDEDFGVDIQKVKEVIKIRNITKLPKAPVFVKGVINLRGDIIPVLDLREKFGLEQAEYGDSTRVIVAEVEGRSVGMVGDSVSHVIRISHDQIEPPPEMAGGISAEYLRGVGKVDEKLIVLLNIDKILSTNEKIELDKVEVKKDALKAS